MFAGAWSSAPKTSLRMAPTSNHFIYPLLVSPSPDYLGSAHMSSPQACIDSTIDKFMVTDTIDQRDNMSLYTELGTVDVAQLFSEAIRRIHNNEPLLRLFDL